MTTTDRVISSRAAAWGAQALEFVRGGLGNHPIYPISYALVAFLLGQFHANSNIESAFESSVQTWLGSAPKNALYAVTIGVLLYLVGFAISKTNSSKAKALVYHSGALGTGIVFATILGVEYGRGIEAVLFGAFRIYAAILIVSALVGIAESRLREQVIRAQEALEDANRQRNIVLTADEETRRDIATFLHNRVQAGLVVTAMQLKMTAAKIQAPHRRELLSLVAELEDIRRFELRSAAQQLSPDLQITGFREALGELFAGYAKSMAIQSTIDPDIEQLDREIQLALYRICEQALLNSVVHGEARECAVSVRISEGGEVIIMIQNDGVGLPKPLPRNGSGSAIIDSWVKKFAGTWTLIEDENSKITLTATLRP